jgi:hypothetical protein
MGNVVFLPLAALAFTPRNQGFRVFPRLVAGNYRISYRGLSEY